MRHVNGKKGCGQGCRDFIGLPACDFRQQIPPGSDWARSVAFGGLLLHYVARTITGSLSGRARASVKEESGARPSVVEEGRGGHACCLAWAAASWAGARNQGRVRGRECWAAGEKGEGEVGLRPERGRRGSVFLFSIFLSFIPKPFSNPF